MDNNLNLTYITLGGFEEMHKVKHLCFVIMFIVYILIICFNSTIICLIWIHRNLHEPMYIFIAALLINSVLYSTNIYPKLLIDLLSEKQILTFSLCLFQAFVYYILATTEFLLLAAMAYDRYVSICKPLQYQTIMRKKVITVFLVLAWILPACELALAIAFYASLKICTFRLKGVFCTTSIYTLQCVRSGVLSVYGVVMLLNIVLFPMLFILYTYTKILIVVYKSCKMFRKKAAETCLPHLLVLINFSCFITYDVTVVRLESDVPQKIHLIMTLQMIMYHPLFNPIIYGVKLKEISKHINSLLLHVILH